MIIRRILILLAIAAGVVACGGAPALPVASEVVQQQSDTVAQDDCVQVLYFHGKKRCITCNAIERLSRQVVDSIGSDRVVMRVIDISDPTNEQIADKYEVTWSSLILVRGDRSENLTKMGFGCAKNRPAEFKASLGEQIDKISQ